MKLEILLSELKRDIHDNAVKHGFWDSERSGEEIFSLIHSEWSEALEEARAGRPLLWHNCIVSGEENFPCETCEDCMDKNPESCKDRCKKPEGIAVELADGCIRILDFLAKVGLGNIDDIYDQTTVTEECSSVSDIVCELHDRTSCAHTATNKSDMIDELMKAFKTAVEWIARQGLDPWMIIGTKHEYNIGRPYKHGKLF